ncbi:unnamed protein product [Darwinula stevensoni]|uniref:DUF1279 domain-containing protein n=1 Tax=Darwinula stevensoni TaxID=69355 RepID=A0A7R9A464_9CRUS|nr:unnamed protein product [Darwinula stevensoni]CAG0893015.1 unnamed protein product [Darwinula stevensoni]
MSLFLGDGKILTLLAACRHAPRVGLSRVISGLACSTSLSDRHTRFWSCASPRDLLAKESLPFYLSWEQSRSPLAVSCRDFHQDAKPGGEGDQVSKGKEEEKTPAKKPGLVQRFKQMYKDYWYILVPVHCVTSAIWFGSFYVIATTGIDLAGLFETWGVTERIVDMLRNSKAGYFAIAYTLYKIFTPLRYMVTIGGTTLSINYLMKWGYIKPVPSKEELRVMYHDKREEWNTFVEDKKGEWEERRQRFWKIRRLWKKSR